MGKIDCVSDIDPSNCEGIIRDVYTMYYCLSACEYGDSWLDCLDFQGLSTPECQ